MWHSCHTWHSSCLIDGTRSCHLSYPPAGYLRMGCVSDHRFKQLGNRVCRRSARPSIRLPDRTRSVVVFVGLPRRPRLSCRKAEKRPTPALSSIICRGSSTAELSRGHSACRSLGGGVTPAGNAHYRSWRHLRQKSHHGCHDQQDGHASERERAVAFKVGHPSDPFAATTWPSLSHAVLFLRLSSMTRAPCRNVMHSPGHRPRAAA